MTVTLENIREAQNILKDVIVSTASLESRSLSDLIGCRAFLKYENEQKTGSFKIRGAYNKIYHLTEEEKARGVIAVSAGNHAQGVALSAKTLGVKARIVMPEFSPIVKVQATRDYGAEVILEGKNFDESVEVSRKLQEQHQYTFVHPYEDERVIAGQGTIGLELIEQIQDLDSVVLSIGGGGLIGGVASALKQLNPKIKVYGVVPEPFQNMMRTFKGKPKAKTNRWASTIADGTAIKAPSSFMYENYIKKYVDDIVAVSDSEIAEAMVFLLERAKTVVEGSGALPIAAALYRKMNLGKRSAFVLSGGNVDLNLISSIINRGLRKLGRLIPLTVIAGDQPGSLRVLTKIIAAHQANILEVHHVRSKPSLSLSQTEIKFLLETKGKAHAESIAQALEQKGFLIKEENS